MKAFVLDDLFLQRIYSNQIKRKGSIIEEQERPWVLLNTTLL